MANEIFNKILSYNISFKILFLSGLNLILLNYIYVRHISTAFRQDELAIYVFTLSYFSGISIGYYLSDKISFGGIKKLLIPVLLLQMFVIIFIQPAAYYFSRAINDIFSVSYTFDYPGSTITFIGIYVLVSLSGTSLYSIFLPKFVLPEIDKLEKMYSVEIAGSIIGILLLFVLSFTHYVVTLSFYFLILLLIFYLIDKKKIILSVSAVIVILFIILFKALDYKFSGWFYKNWYGKNYVENVTFSSYSPYHKIEVLNLQNGDRMLVLNGKRQFAKGSHFVYSYFVSEYPAQLFFKPTVCILGCGSMSTVGRIGNNASSIQIVDIDEKVFETSKKYFKKFNRLNELFNWKFTADDAKHFLANDNRHYDLILHDIPPAHSRQVALTYTKEFFEIVKSKLNPNGIFSISSLTPLNSESSYGKRLIATLADVFDNYFALRYNDDIYFYGGTRGFKIPDKLSALSKVNHPGKEKVTYLNKAEIQKMVGNSEIITINNLGDLIFE